MVGSRGPSGRGASWSCYRPDAADADPLTETVARLTGTEAGGEPAANGHAPVSVEPGSTLTGGLRDAARLVDQRVQQTTRGALGLAGRAPPPSTSWALGELVRGRTGPLAWSTALWYAHGLYRDYSLPPTRD